jgi:predicted dehydrogenase
VRFDDGTVAQVTAADVVLGGIRNQLAVYAAKAVIFCNINPNAAVQAYAPDPAVFAGEYITERIETKAGWTSPQPDEDWMSGYPAELQDFAESVALGREPVSGGALARDVVAVVYGAYLSAGEGRRIELGPYLR